MLYTSKIEKLIIKFLNILGTAADNHKMLVLADLHTFDISYYCKNTYIWRFLNFGFFGGLCKER